LNQLRILRNGYRVCSSILFRLLSGFTEDYERFSGEIFEWISHAENPARIRDGLRCFKCFAQVATDSDSWIPLICHLLDLAQGFCHPDRILDEYLYWPGDTLFLKCLKVSSIPQFLIEPDSYLIALLSSIFSIVGQFAKRGEPITNTSLLELIAVAAELGTTIFSNLSLDMPGHLLLSSLYEVFLPLLIPLITLAPYALPDHYLLFSSHLLAMVRSGYHITRIFPADYLDLLLQCILIQVQVPQPDDEAFSFPSEALANAAFYEPNIGASYPRSLAVDTFTELFVTTPHLSRAVAFLSNAGYSEGLVHLLHVMAGSIPDEAIEICVDILRKYSQHPSSNPPHLDLLSYVRTLSAYLAYLQDAEASLVRAYSEDLMTNYCPQGTMYFDSVAFTVGVELLCATLRHGIPPTDAQREILVQFAEGTMMHVGLEALLYASQSPADFGNVIDRCCREIIDRVNEIIDQMNNPALSGGQTRPDWTYSENHFTGLSNIVLGAVGGENAAVPFDLVFEAFAKLTDTDILPTPFLCVLVECVQRQCPEAADLGRNVTQLLLAPDAQWDGLEFDFARILLTFACVHPDAIREFAHRILELVLGFTLTGKDLSGVVDLVCGFVQLGFVEGEGLAVVAGRMPECCGDDASDVFVLHSLIRMFATLFLAGGPGMEMGMVQQWIELIGAGWFSYQYGRKLAILCCHRWMEGGAAPEFEGVAMALLANALPPRPVDLEYLCFWEYPVPMPLDANEQIEGFVEENNV
jgi:hypothetical protein